MKSIIIIVSIILCICTASCGNGNEVEITPLDTNVSGDLKGLYKVSNRTYKLRTTDDNEAYKIWDLYIDLERTKDSSINLNNGELGFGVEILDKDNNVLAKENVSTWDMNGEFETIQNLKAGDNATLTFRLGGHYDLKNAKKFRVLTKLDNDDDDIGYYTTYSYANLHTYDNDIITKSLELGNWDETLDYYEQFVNKYLTLKKKAINGDRNAMAEYPIIMDKANELSERLANAKKSLSATQLNRYANITVRFILSDKHNQ